MRLTNSDMRRESYQKLERERKRTLRRARKEERRLQRRVVATVHMVIPNGQR